MAAVAPPMATPEFSIKFLVASVSAACFALIPEGLYRRLPVRAFITPLCVALAVKPAPAFIEAYAAPP